MPLNQSRNMPRLLSQQEKRSMREEKHEGREKLRIPLNSGNPNPDPPSAIANMPESYGIQKKKGRKNINVQ